MAIVLLWLAGFCFFLAFEGSKVLNEASTPTSGGMLKAIVQGLAQKAVDAEAAGQATYQTAGAVA